MTNNVSMGKNLSRNKIFKCITVKKHKTFYMPMKIIKKARNGLCDQNMLLDKCNVYL